jgi:hypothetical protein
VKQGILQTGRWRREAISAGEKAATHVATQWTRLRHVVLDSCLLPCGNRAADGGRLHHLDRVRAHVAALSRSVLPSKTARTDCPGNAQLRQICPLTRSAAERRKSFDQKDSWTFGRIGTVHAIAGVEATARLITYEKTISIRFPIFLVGILATGNGKSAEDLDAMGTVNTSRQQGQYYTDDHFTKWPGVNVRFYREDYVLGEGAET